MSASPTELADVYKQAIHQALHQMATGNPPPQQPGYLPQQQQGYPPQQPGYPPQQPGYPPQQPGYQPQQPGYQTQQPGSPQQQPEYPTQQQPYPQQTQGDPQTVVYQQPLSQQPPPEQEVVFREDKTDTAAAEDCATRSKRMAMRAVRWVLKCCGDECAECAGCDESD